MCNLGSIIKIVMTLSRGNGGLRASQDRQPSSGLALGRYTNQSLICWKAYGLLGHFLRSDGAGDVQSNARIVWAEEMTITELNPLEPASPITTATCYGY